MSTADQAPVIKLEKTANLARIFEKIEGGSTWELLDIFVKWPLDEIRRKVIQKLLDRPYQDQAPNSKVEEIIRQLSLNHEYYYWKGLLSWYVANSISGCEAVKAVEFAIAFSKEFDEKLEVAKAISGRLKRDPELYWQAPSMRRFIDKLISGLRFEYPEWQWTQAERAIRRIVQVRDTTYLPKIEELLGLFGKGVYKLCEHEGDEFTFGQNLQFLRDAARILKQAQQEQMPDLNVAVGSYLREWAGLTGSVNVRLECPQESDPAKLTVPVKVVVKLELTEPTPAEVAKLTFVLGRCRVEWWGEGFSGTKVIGNDKETEEGVFNSQFCCGFSSFPSRGSNRFSLGFINLKNWPHGDRERFAQISRYLIIE